MIATLQSGASGKIDGGSDVDTLNTRASYRTILLVAIMVKLMVSTTQALKINMGDGADKHR